MKTTRYKHTHYTSPNFVKSGQRAVASLRNADIVRQGYRVLDYGCGWGRITFRLDDAFGVDIKLTAVDLNEKCVAHIRSMRPHIDVLRRSTPLDEPFDVCLCFNVLQHLPVATARAFLAILARNSRAGVFFTYPDMPRTDEPSEWLSLDNNEQPSVFPTYDQSRYAPEDVVCGWGDGEFYIEPRQDISPTGYLVIP